MGVFQDLGAYVRQVRQSTSRVENQLYRGCLGVIEGSRVSRKIRGTYTGRIGVKRV